jgi:4-hydroxy-3-methylbut-2-enyl diphosphate reductase
MAVKALAWLTVLEPGPVFCVHEIVHNRAVADRFRRLGVCFVDRVEDVSPGATVMLSAHGSAPSDVIHAAGRSAFLVDAVCPLVTKVHHEIRSRTAKGMHVLYLGHAGHDETLGALGVAPHGVELVETEADVRRSARRLPRDRQVALLAQTTLDAASWDAAVAAVREEHGAVWTPSRADLCYATTNRQAAVAAVAPRCDTIVVVGSATSSNTAALVEVARRSGCPHAVRVDGPDDLPDSLGEVVAVTAGASAPEDAVRAVVDALGVGPDAIEHVAGEDESVYFPLPVILRRRIAQARADRTLPWVLHAAADEDRHTSAASLLSVVEEVRSPVSVSGGRRGRCSSGGRR